MTAPVRDTVRKALPATLKPERLTKMSLACRFGWHQWVWGEVDELDSLQEKRCMKCGRSKEVWR